MVEIEARDTWSDTRPDTLLTATTLLTNGGKFAVPSALWDVQPNTLFTTTSLLLPAVAGGSISTYSDIIVGL